MPMKSLRALPIVFAGAMALAACGEPTQCLNQKQVAVNLAKLSADVQSATLKNKINMKQLRELTIRVDTAGSHYSAAKNANQYCKDMDAIRADFGL